MTTIVKISMPEQNHKRVRVDQVDVDADGNEVGVNSSVELDHGETSENMCVYDIRVLKITEID